MSEEKIFDIEVENDGTYYKGWANPSDKLNDEGFPGFISRSAEPNIFWPPLL
jgi:hypothetical protein